MKIKSQLRFKYKSVVSSFLVAFLLLASTGVAYRLARAQSSSETWVSYTPTAQQTTLDILSCGGRTFAKVKFTFNEGGYRVTDWGQASGAGFGAAREGVKP